MTFEPFPRILVPDEVPAIAPALRCQSVILENGLVVLITENPVADIVAARIFVDAGGYRELPDQSGLSHLSATLLTKGTQNFSARNIATQVESIGASLGVDSTPDYFLVTLKTVGADFDAMLRLAAELIQRPTFPENELELERQLTLQAIRARQEQPLAIALQQLRQSIYLEHPYSQSSLGTLESVAKIQRSHLQTFHAQYFRPDRTILSIAGNISLEQLQPLVDEIFGGWKSADHSPAPRTVHTLLHPPTRSVQCQANQQSIAMLGCPAPTVQHRDYPALKLLSTYLWNGLSSRLFTELREKKGLAYEVSGLYPTRLDTSHFVIYLGTAAQNTALALALLQSELEDVCNQPLPELTIDAAKRKLLGQYALGKQTNQQIAQLLGWYEYLQLGIDYDQRFSQLIRAVTPAQVHQAAKQHLSHPFVSVVGPAEAIATV